MMRDDRPGWYEPRFVNLAKAEPPPEETTELQRWLTDPDYRKRSGSWQDAMDSDEEGKDGRI